MGVIPASVSHTSWIELRVAIPRYLKRRPDG